MAKDEDEDQVVECDPAWKSEYQMWIVEQWRRYLEEVGLGADFTDRWGLYGA